MCIWHQRHQRCDSPVWGGGGGRAQEKNLTEKLGFFLKALKDFLCHIYIYIYLSIMWNVQRLHCVHQFTVLLVQYQECLYLSLQKTKSFILSYSIQMPNNIILYAELQMMHFMFLKQQNVKDSLEVSTSYISIFSANVLFFQAGFSPWLQNFQKFQISVEHK